MAAEEHEETKEKQPPPPKKAVAGKKNSSGGNGGGFITKYFLLIMLLFAGLSLVLNIYVSSNTKHHNDHDMGSLRQTLRNDFVRSFKMIRNRMGGVGDNDSSGDDDNNNYWSRDNYADGGEGDNDHHKLAGLSCDRFGGPNSREAVEEMVYWSDIPSDNKHVSPFKQNNRKQYLTFEPDHGGWNNIRMSMETVLAMAFAMGRTLVLPPETKLYLLAKEENHHHKESSDANKKKQRHHFSFNHFFHMESIHNEHPGLDIITMKQFLEETAMKGMLRRDNGTTISFPPGNRTDWDGVDRQEIKQLWFYLRDVSHMVLWDPNDCMATIPASTDPTDTQHLKNIKQTLGKPKLESFIGRPVPVNASASDRMKENWADRKELCIYDDELQRTDLVHFPADPKLDARLLVHFYAFLFFQDWKQDLWMKRFIRDHVRYIDEIQCAAARVIEAIRKRVMHRKPNANGEYDSFHVRRGEFQYKVTRLEAKEIYEMSKSKLTPDDTVYISTDEKDKSFFQPLMDVYDVVFLDDFIDDLGKDINTNYYGMIDQLVASRGRVFFGCWFSTFTGYINRLRGYHSQKDKLPGYEHGHLDSYYYALKNRYSQMRQYHPVKKSYYAQEFPTSWRLIDESVGL